MALPSPPAAPPVAVSGPAVMTALNRMRAARSRGRDRTGYQVLWFLMVYILLPMF
jgi:hypothetical protein